MVDSDQPGALQLAPEHARCPVRVNAAMGIGLALLAIAAVMYCSQLVIAAVIGIARVHAPPPHAGDS
jgi:hypothetical protein